MIYSEAGNFLMFWSNDHGERNNGFLTSGRMVQGELHLPTPKENHDRAKAWIERMEAEKNGQKIGIGRDRRKAKNRENHAETERLIEEERNAEAQD